MKLNFQHFGQLTHAESGTSWEANTLADEVYRRVRLFRSLGLATGDMVLIHHGGTLAFFADLFAAWHCGACAVCVNPGATAPEVKIISEFIEPTLSLYEEGGASADGLKVRVVRPSVDAAGLEPDPSDVGGADLDGDALILFTSGTTSQPKGVVHSFRSILARMTLNVESIGAQFLQRSLCILPTHFGHGLIGNCLTPLYAGGDLVIAPGNGVGALAAVPGFLKEHDVTFMSSVPAMWKILLKIAQPPNGNSLNRVHVGSAPLSIDLWQSISEWAGTPEVYNMYGITETCNWIGGGTLVDAQSKDGFVGSVWGGAAAVVSADGQMTRTGEGEILIQTPSLMRGYHRLPELTQDILVNGWFRTGDIGRLDSGGQLWLTGREKFEINNAGIKVHPEDVDLLMERHPDVEETYCFGIPDEVSGEAVGIAVVLMQGASATAEKLSEWCRSRLRAECIPQRWYFVDDIPKSDRGKVNRDTVREICLKQPKSKTASRALS